MEKIDDIIKDVKARASDIGVELLPPKLLSDLSFILHEWIPNQDKIEKHYCTFFKTPDIDLMIPDSIDDIDKGLDLFIIADKNFICVSQTEQKLSFTDSPFDFSDKELDIRKNFLELTMSKSMEYKFSLVDRTERLKDVLEFSKLIRPRVKQ